ncbi:MAG: ATP-binding protein [Acidimicrobiaceae bacterium]|nr:ATP-binding protein [Acidimicrobiaceae bacterium]MXZ64825.1 ATP-binding protein [Acidimicrobiaceae bacterium]MYF32280.1 ATP-binding protein [Acidimicrobiaceae bacterium]MYG77746.1 ATP-binding protein [Acidimicrobiaceae bacterium]MYJ30610.1 ATP-binding protein [Acidimicrobiaceae bacterium]
MDAPPQHPFPGYRPRVSEKDIEDALSRRGAVLIEGVRWCGKTWTALRFARSALRLDDDDALRLADIDPGEALRGDAPRLVDEWQNAPHLWNRIRRECDERPDLGQFILTGSASPSDDVTRHTGTGRIGRVTLRPMSLFETGASDGSVSLRGLFAGEATSGMARDDIGLRDIASHICIGGWPANIGVEEGKARRSVRDHLHESVLVDIRAASGVRHDRERVLNLVRSVARNVATEARTAKLVADMAGENGEGGIWRQTANEYLTALRRIFLLEDQPSWPVHLRSRAVLRKAPKLHLVDPSLAAAALRASPEQLISDIKTLGFLFESLVVRDLRVYSQPDQASVYHYRDSDNLEVDAVVARNDGAWMAVEIKLGHRPDTIDAAAAGLLRLRDKVTASRRSDLAGLVVVTALGPAYRRRDGIHVVPITALGP